MDKRIVKTRKNILDVFLQLLEEKPVGEITAQEIAELAQISRSTFYLHYTDVYNLLEQAENEIFDEISNLLEGYTYEIIKSDPLRLFTDLFHYFAHNAKICVVLLTKNGSITTGQRISKMIEEKFQNEWEQLISHQNPREAHYLSVYAIAGFVGILQAWMAGGMEEPAEEMAALARSMLSNSIHQHRIQADTQTDDKKEGLNMSTFKNQMREDAAGFVGKVLNNTSGLIDEKSAEIQQKVESGLATASSRLAQKGTSINTRQISGEYYEEKLRKLDQKKIQLEEKLQEKIEKLTLEGKEADIQKEQRKYQEDLRKLEEKRAELEAARPQQQ